MSRRAFTLIELLVVIAIVATLAAIIMPLVGYGKKQGQLAREIAAGRQLGAAYLSAAADHNGELMGGYVSDPGEVFDDQGKPVEFPASGRYPWRLAKYLGNRVRGTLIVNQQAKLAENRSHGDYVYLVSFTPTFGMNATYVGGNYRISLAPTQTALSRFGPFVVTRLAQAVKPQKLILFCSARYNASKTMLYGHSIVEAPATTSRTWSAKYRESDPAESFGYVHPRYDEKAVVVMLDGHVEMLDTEQLQDMRYWSNQAAELDRPDFVLTRER
jgi:prepilin-type N-terminal cleavage/methylation domain-containing protein/prepilin-type processing-associated H-X9-DG protein